MLVASIGDSVDHGFSVFFAWIPALLGSVAFVQLRNTLRREVQPAAMCLPLAEPLEVVRPPALAG